MVKNSDLLAEFLKHKKIDTVFGIIGSANAHIFDSIVNLGYTKIVCVHHEQAAVMAMGSFYRTSGRLSAALVTAGAGSANAITGVLSNWADSIPGMIISGQERSDHVIEYGEKNRRMYGIQGFDSPHAVEKMTKYSKTILDANDLQNALECAYELTLEDGRPGPVWIDIPSDIQSTMVDQSPWRKRIECESIIDWKREIGTLIEKSKRPVIIAGHGIKLAGAKKEFRELVDELQIPVIQTWAAMDLLPPEHLLNFGKSGVMGQRSSNFIVQNSDLVLSIGSRLSIFQTGYDTKDFAPNAHVVVVDIDPTENKERINSFVEEDCKVFINCFLDNAVGIDSQRPEWLGFCHDLYNKYPLLMEEHKNEDEFINSYKFLHTVQPLIPHNAIITTDMGTALLSGFYMMEPTENQQMFTSLGLGEMGYGLPGAIGAAFANPNKPIICLNCDGGMMMNLQELQTIGANNLNIKIVVFNNDGYLMIKHTQNLLFGGRQTCVDQSNGVTVPDFGKVAFAFGIPNFKIRSERVQGIKSIWNMFMDVKGPALCEVFMAPDQDFIPKVKPLSVGEKIVPAPLEEMSPLLPLEEIENSMININPKSKDVVR